MMNRERMTRMSQTMGDGPTSIGLSERLERVLTYLFGWISGLFFFIFERKNRNVQWHAKQSMAVFGLLSLVYLAVKFVAFILGLIPLIGGFFVFILGFLLTIIVWVWIILAIWLMLMAWFKPNYRFPFISNFLGR
jgi:uncharacterized membrane protein